MYAKPCCLSLVSAAHLCPLHHVPPLSGCGVLAVYIWPQHDWWLESGADSGSSPLSARSLPTHVRAPSASFLRHSCQVSQNNDYLSPETNLHSDTFPGWCLVAWGLLCRGPLPTSQSSCETSFLHVCKTCQEANIEVWERERSLYSLFLWSLLTNNYSYARCPGCTANVPTFLHGRTAELKAWGKKKKKKTGWGFSTFKVANCNLRGPECAWRSQQLLWRSCRCVVFATPVLRGLQVAKHSLHQNQFLSW